MWDLDEELFFDLPNQSINKLSSVPKCKTNWFTRILLDKRKMLEYNFDIGSVRRIVEKYLDGYAKVYATNPNSGVYAISMNWYHITQMSQKLELKEITQQQVKTMEASVLLNLQAYLLNLLNPIALSGVCGINRVYVTEYKSNTIDNETGEVKEKTEYILETEGSNLLELLSNPIVDSERTYSNDIHEVFNVLDIEAAVNILFQEINQVISFDGTYVDPRHITLVANAMTHKGSIIAMTRHGANKTNSGFLSKASFEKPMEILLDSAVYNAVDTLQGPTPTIIFGKRSNVGTGAFDILSCVGIDGDCLQEDSMKTNFVEQNGSQTESVSPKTTRKRKAHENNFDEDLDRLYKKQKCDDTCNDAGEEIVSTLVFDQKIDSIENEGGESETVHSLILKQEQHKENYFSFESNQLAPVVNPFFSFENQVKKKFTLPSPQPVSIEDGDAQLIDWNQ